MTKYSELSHNDFLTDMKGIRISTDAKNKASRILLEKISKELRQFDQETNKVFLRS